jgi:hypothetical protein
MNKAFGVAGFEVTPAGAAENLPAQGCIELIIDDSLVECTAGWAKTMQK